MINTRQVLVLGQLLAGLSVLLGLLLSTANGAVLDLSGKCGDVSEGGVDHPGATLENVGLPDVISLKIEGVFDELLGPVVDGQLLAASTVLSAVEDLAEIR